MPFDRLNPHETAYKPKLVLRCLAFALITVAIIPAAYSWRLSIFVLPIIILSWLWNLINIIKRLRSEYPVHPGANIAFDLIIHLLFVILGGLNLAVAIFANVITNKNWKSNPLFSSRWGNLENCKNVTTKDEDDEETTSQQCTVPQDQIDLVQRLAKASLAACSFAAIVCFLHFVFFIWACVDAHRRRRERRDAIAAFQGQAQKEMNSSASSTIQEEPVQRTVWPVFA